MDLPTLLPFSSCLAIGSNSKAIFYTDGEFSDDPFFVLRAGFDIEVLPSLRLDLNANYHFTDFESISTVDEDVDTDTITLGAMVRFEF